MKLDSVKQSLERMTCREHGKHPQVAIAGGSLKIECCCEAFRSEVNQKSKVLIAEQAKKELGDKLKNIFK
ncbi:hypothetical protein [Bacteroides heparinolyticus]|uniref:hypothetical protein n=1 Tax=Prevotella heparinolytica TaxID=28113 RepID=UPI00359F2CAE